MTEREILRKYIHQVVSGCNGCKATELPGLYATQLASDPSAMSVFLQLNFVDEVESMVEDNELVEISYTVPNVSYREKSFLLPCGSAVHSTRGLVKKL